jgi:hypothetical protein
MRLMLIVLVLLSFLFVGNVNAQEAPPDFSWAGFTLEPELHLLYFFNGELENTAGVGGGVKLVNLIDGLVGIYIEAAMPINPDTDIKRLMGISGLLDAGKGINMIGGKTIIPKNVKFGATGLLDVTHGLEDTFSDIYFAGIIVGVQF